MFSPSISIEIEILIKSINRNKNFDKNNPFNNKKLMRVESSPRRRHCRTCACQEPDAAEIMMAMVGSNKLPIRIAMVESGDVRSGAQQRSFFKTKPFPFCGKKKKESLSLSVVIKKKPFPFWVRAGEQLVVLLYSVILIRRCFLSLSFSPFIYKVSSSLFSLFLDSKVSLSLLFRLGGQCPVAFPSCDCLYSIHPGN